MPGRKERYQGCALAKKRLSRATTASRSGMLSSSLSVAGRLRRRRPDEHDALLGTPCGGHYGKGRRRVSRRKAPPCAGGDRSPRRVLCERNAGYGASRAGGEGAGACWTAADGDAGQGTEKVLRAGALREGRGDDRRHTRPPRVADDAQALCADESRLEDVSRLRGRESRGRARPGGPEARGPLV